MVDLRAAGDPAIRAARGAYSALGALHRNDRDKLTIAANVWRHTSKCIDIRVPSAHTSCMSGQLEGLAACCCVAGKAGCDLAGAGSRRQYDGPSAWESLSPVEVLRLLEDLPRVGALRRSFTRCWGGRGRLWSATCG